MSRSRLDALRVLSLFAIIVFLRVAWVGRYPEYNSDEGFWANGARNHVLFGDAFLDNRLHPFLSPATYAALTAFFSALTPTLVSARLFSATAGILTGVLVWRMARRLVPERPWLPLLLFGFSGTTLLIHRMMLLEAHQIFWLVVAAALFLSRSRGSLWLAGAAYGVALLVKSNSIYLAPAFLAALPLDPEAAGAGKKSFLSRWFSLVPLFAAALIVAGAGYGAARAHDPQRFAWAFSYELDATHFLNDDVLVHFGRFGLRPRGVASAVGALIKADPFLILLAGVSIVRVLRKPSAATGAERFFTVWALGCLVFDSIQIIVTYRYLTTMAPALVFLAATTLDRAFSKAHATPPDRRYRLGALALCGLLGAYQIARLGLGFSRQPNREYWQAVDWIREHEPKDTGVLAASYISLSLPQRSYDFYRLLVAYDADHHRFPIADEVQRRNITVIVRDTEWRLLEAPDMASFLASPRCTRLATFGSYEIFRVAPPDHAMAEP
jgi:hypothetical protein